jgi:hypothetical protein
VFKKYIFLTLSVFKLSPARVYRPLSLLLLTWTRLILARILTTNPTARDRTDREVPHDLEDIARDLIQGRDLHGAAGNFKK